MRTCLFFTVLLAWSGFALPGVAQDAPATLVDGFMGRFNYAAHRLVALAEAVPEDTYAWRPGEGVMSVEHVFMHIIRYNYLYPATSLGLPAPEDIEMDELEAMTGKAAVEKHLQRSLDHVRQVAKQLSEEDLRRSVTLYGQQTEAMNVLLQLQMHMGEHLGQLIAYARMNDIVPPWSR